jgi:hypothetical protein
MRVGCNYEKVDKAGGGEVRPKRVEKADTPCTSGSSPLYLQLSSSVRNIKNKLRDVAATMIAGCRRDLGCYIGPLVE